MYCTVRTVCGREALEVGRIFAISCILCSLVVQSTSLVAVGFGRSDARLQIVGRASCVADEPGVSLFNARLAVFEVNGSLMYRAAFQKRPELFETTLVN